MKKFISLLIVLATCLSIGSVAYADGGNAEPATEANVLPLYTDEVFEEHLMQDGSGTTQPNRIGYGAYQYFLEPPSGTVPSDYTTKIKTKYGSLDADQRLIDASKDVLASIIEQIVGGIGPGITGEVLSALVGPTVDFLCQNIQTMAQRFAPGSEEVGYTIDVFELDYSPAPLCYYYKNIINYYCVPVSKGNVPDEMWCGSAVYYEVMTNYARSNG